MEKNINRFKYPEQIKNIKRLNWTSPKNLVKSIKNIVKTN